MRSFERGGTTTNLDHLPASHKRYAEESDAGFETWATTVGAHAHALALVRTILIECPHPEHGLRSCRCGLKSLTRTYSLDRIEAACERALVAGARSYLNVESILKCGLDQQPLIDPVQSHEQRHRSITKTSAARTTTTDRGRTMLTEPTTEKLQAMRLDAMAAKWREQTGKPDVHKLAFDERFGMLVDAEWLHRENKRLATALRDARLRIANACIEDIDYSPKRELDKALIRQLASCRWIVEHQNVIISGKTGTGKTYIACALAQQACRKGYRAIYRRAPRLYQELALARADGTYPRLLARLARTDVLIIDDWALSPLSADQRNDVLEILEDRYGGRSTIFASQLDAKRYHEYLGDPTVADAVCDRLIHNAHRVVLSGPSRRKEEAPIK